MKPQKEQKIILASFLRKCLIVLIVTSTTIISVGKSQDSNPCGKSWSEWQSAWNLSNGDVEFRLEFPSKSCGCGTNFVELRHSLPQRVKITIRLEGYDCDGKKYGERFFSDAIAGGEISKKGAIYHWFRSVPNAVGVILEFDEGGKKIRLEKDNFGTRKFINGMSEAEQQLAENEKIISYDQLLTSYTKDYEVIHNNYLREKITSSPAYELANTKIFTELTDAKLLIRNSSGMPVQKLSASDEKRFLILIEKIKTDLLVYNNVVTNLLEQKEIKQEKKEEKREAEKIEKERMEDEKKRSDTTKNERYSNTYNADDEEDKFMGTAVVTSAALNMIAIDNVRDFNNNPSENFISGSLGFGYFNYPMITTNYSTLFSSPSTSKNRGINSVFIDLGASYNHMSEGFFSYSTGVFFRYGTNSLLDKNSGVSGSHSQFGTELKAMLGKRIKVNLVGGWNTRSGDMSTNSQNYSFEAYYGKYKYSFYRYGGGLSYHAEGLNRGFELYAVQDKVISGDNIQSNALVYGLKLKYTLVLSFEYSPQYITAGSIDYPATYDQNSSLSQFLIHATVPFVLWKRD